MNPIEKDIELYGNQSGLTGKERFKEWLKQVSIEHIRKLVNDESAST
jgi:hypothetical protein